MMPKDYSSRDSKGSKRQRLVQPAVEPENNAMEQQTGRPRTTLPRGVPSTGRRRTVGAPVARRPR